jgi:hypothetical protein
VFKLTYLSQMDEAELTNKNHTKQNRSIHRFRCLGMSSTKGVEKRDAKSEQTIVGSSLSCHGQLEGSSAHRQLAGPTKTPSLGSLPI